MSLAVERMGTLRSLVPGRGGLKRCFVTRRLSRPNLGKLDDLSPGRGLTAITRVQITIREFSADRRLRRLLCGKAAPFRRRGLRTNLIRAAEGIAFAAARMKRKPGQIGRKGRAFPQSRGAKPLPSPLSPHNLNSVVLTLPRADGICAGLGARSGKGWIFAANIRTRPALKMSIKLNCPSNPEFFCKIHVKLP